MIHFDDVLTTARDVLAEDTDFHAIERVLVLRDLRGRIRLFLTPKPEAADAVRNACSRLNTQLADALGGFWGQMIEPDVPESQVRALLDTVRAEALPLEPGQAFENWSIIERHVSQSVWSKRDAAPPWPLLDETPAIVSFFSHKGGVGRTTALCATAVNLARVGKRVVVIDLDLEAPGLGPLLPESPVELGVADYFLEYFAAAGDFHPRIEDFVAIQNETALIGPGGEPIRCVPAGRVGPTYLEKLGRLDYELITGTTSADGGPVPTLFKQLRAAYKPEYVLLDCRCGLHDLGGLAIQCLSHLNVVFGLDSQVSWDGLRLIVQRMRQSGSNATCLLIHAMEPPPGDIRRKAHDRFQSNAYSIFLEEFYVEPDYDTAPDIDDADAPHSPFGIAYESALAGYQTLSDVCEILTKSPYSDLTRRISDIVGRPTS